MDELDDFRVVCRSFPQHPGHTHTVDLLLAFSPSCNESHGALLDTRADFEFLLDMYAMRLVEVHPRGGPVAGGTHVRVLGGGFGGRDIRCRFGENTVAATYVDGSTLQCVTPSVHEPHDARLEVTPDGGAQWTLPLTFSFYETSTPRVSSVWPLGGPCTASATPRW